LLDTKVLSALRRRARTHPSTAARAGFQPICVGLLDPWA
jgi:hypothetical protein